MSVTVASSIAVSTSRFVLVLNLRSGMQVHQPTYENLEARLCVIQERVALAGAAVASALMALISASASALLQGFIIFCSFCLIVVFSITTYSPENNTAALFISTAYNEIVND